MLVLRTRTLLTYSERKEDRGHAKPRPSLLLVRAERRPPCPKQDNGKPETANL